MVSRDCCNSSFCVWRNNTHIALPSAATTKVIMGVGSATLATRGARAVANLETKLRKPKAVDENKVGKTDEWET